MSNNDKKRAKKPIEPRAEPSDNSTAPMGKMTAQQVNASSKEAIRPAPVSMAYKPLRKGIPIIDMGQAHADISFREPRSLLIQQENASDQVVPLFPDKSYLFGRAAECTVVFFHDAVSRQHGRLSMREDHRWVYRDLGSTNKSYLGVVSDDFDYGELNLEESLDEDDERNSFKVMSSSRDWVVEAGNVILLGNGRSRIVLSEELPRHVTKVVTLPMLEQRRDDIPKIIETILHRIRVEEQLDAKLSADAIAYLQQADWPEQIAQLEKAIRALLTYARGKREKESGVSSAAQLIVTQAMVEEYAKRASSEFGSYDETQAGMGAYVPGRAK